MDPESADALLDKRLLDSYDADEETLNEAWMAWLARNEGRLISYARTLIHDDPEQLILDALLATHENLTLAKYEQRGKPLVGYVKKIMFYMLDRVREIVKLSESLDEYVEAYGDLPPDVYERLVEEIIIKKESHRELLSCISCLPEKQALSLVGHYLYDIETDEIAQCFGMTPAAVRKMRSRAVEELKRIMAGKPWVGDLCA